MSGISNYNDPDKYNLLLDIQKVQLSPFYAMRMVEIKVSTNPADGDIYKVGSKQNSRGIWEDVYALSKGPLEQMAKAAGIIWSPTETKTITATKDYVLYEAVGAIRSPSGEYIPIKGSKEIDITAIEAESRKSKRDYIEKQQKFAVKNQAKKKELEELLKGRTPEEWVESEVQSALIQWRKNKVARAETGAMLRAIRKLLTIKNTYSREELEKPFIIPCVDFSPDYNDPNVRMMIQKQGMRAASDLFGVKPAPVQIPPHIEVESRPAPEPQAIEAPAPAAPELQHNKDEKDFCHECGVKVAPNVRDYSERRFGATYCRDCQKGRQ